jgi:hypothetical protein
LTVAPFQPDSSSYPESIFGNLSAGLPIEPPSYEMQRSLSLMTSVEDIRVIIQSISKRVEELALDVNISQLITHFNLVDHQVSQMADEPGLDSQFVHSNIDDLRESINGLRNEAGLLKSRLDTYPLLSDEAEYSGMARGPVLGSPIISNLSRANIDTIDNLSENIDVLGTRFESLLRLPQRQHTRVTATSGAANRGSTAPEQNAIAATSIVAAQNINVYRERDAARLRGREAVFKLYSDSGHMSNDVKTALREVQASAKKVNSAVAATISDRHAEFKKALAKFDSAIRLVKVSYADSQINKFIKRNSLHRADAKVIADVATPKELARLKEMKIQIALGAKYREKFDSLPKSGIRTNLVDRYADLLKAFVDAELSVGVPEFARVSAVFDKRAKEFIL